MEEILEVFKEDPRVHVCSGCNRPYFTKRKSLDAEIITKSISKYYGGIDLREKTRRQTHVIARQMAFKILHNYTSMSLKECADYYRPATQDHTTALHGIKIITDRIKYEDRIAEDYNNIIELIIKDHDLI
jgi:chromosomal replication initiation ATPase DnaA